MPSTKKKFDIWTVISLLILGLYGLFLLYPLFRLLMESIFKHGTFTLEYFTKFFSNPYYGTTLVHSFKLSIAATAFALPLISYML